MLFKTVKEINFFWDLTCMQHNLHIALTYIMLLTLICILKLFLTYDEPTNLTASAVLDFVARSADISFLSHSLTIAINSETLTVV